jgi:anti-sigma B factor antagonist
MNAVPVRRPCDAPFLCVVERDGGAATVVPHGELDLASAPVLDATLEGLWVAGATRLTIDLRRLDLIDSAGVHLLLRWRSRGGPDVRIVRGRRAVHQVITLSGAAVALGLARAPDS